MEDLNVEVRKDGELLVAVIELLKTESPWATWPSDARSALTGAVGIADGVIEREKAARLERHLFAGPTPARLLDVRLGPPRRSDRLRADLADLTPYGAGLYLLVS